MAAFFAFLGPFHTAFAFAGTLIVLCFILTSLYFFAKNVFVFYLAEPLGLTVDFKNLGKWAVVTGATDGIGKAYAFDLARRGCNVILVSRTLEKLEDVAKEIEAKYPKIQTKVIAVDFTEDESVYDKVRHALQDLEIGTLINNVGMGHPYPEYFHKLAGGEEFMLKMIRCNCVSQTLMTRIVLPGMVKRGKGVVVSLSSAAGEYPVPFLAVYSGTKAFNDFLGRSLEQEYRDKGVIFQVVQPFMVATNLSGTRKTNLFILGAQEYARSCLNSVGWFTKTNGHPSHALQNWVGAVVPAFLRSKIMYAGMTSWHKAVVNKLKKKGTYKEE
ncbi:Very-long-chain 3-oxoacyl-CoA reductase-B [Hypsibius exemplaris]|uniref:Very-long-chain 3-oxoacyl-CoA reductase-B n=1 Tax=Hypsibius exemplaris TaxID=2072580 RepID=A0A1W0WYD8_HYPEX|nr:Very-long-chain 3-oxoacyl-CoA reductase-B [Hypsibius exemplaris]